MIGGQVEKMEEDTPPCLGPIYNDSAKNSRMAELIPDTSKDLIKFTTTKRVVTFLPKLYS